MSGKPWTDLELKLLRQSRMRPAALATALERTLSAVYQRIRIEGKSQSQGVKRPGFPQFVASRHAEGWCDDDIAKAWGGTGRHSVGNERRRQGLQSNRFGPHHIAKVQRNLARQLRESGLSSSGQIRAMAHHKFAAANGWPSDLRPRAVQILNLLWDRGPMSRPELCTAMGMTWRGSRKSLCSNDPEGSYLANLAARGLIIVLPRKKRIVGQGGGRSQNIYSLPLSIERKPA